jgi:tetratricopeptide (TPR) repeat protein
VADAAAEVNTEVVAPDEQSAKVEVTTDAAAAEQALDDDRGLDESPPVEQALIDNGRPDEPEPAEQALVDNSRPDESAPVEQMRDHGRLGEPALPADIQLTDLDPEARRELHSLSKSAAELVGRHLVAAGRLIDDDPEQALAHARFARSRASRVAVVREAAGLAAYHAGEWAEALGELRAVRRMSGGQTHLPVMADCERALGRPERALELAAEATDLPKDVAVELRIVAAGARRDMGQLDAAVVALQGPDLDPRIREPWTPRLFYAYADNLEAAGRTDDAIRWFLNAAEADVDEETDAAERAFQLREPE